MRDLDDVLSLDATGQAALVREKKISAEELVRAAIERAETENPKLNAIVSPLYERAVDAARGPLPEGPFTGVPFLVKDLVASVRGAPKTECTRFLEGNIASEDSELVRRYRAAGLVILGLTNASEFGILPTTEPRLFGATRNPWNLAHSPGGSSGGSAAAVAAGIVPMAHANDWGGSIRIPASCCGLFGLKPTRARNPLGPRFGDMLAGLVQEHVVTRSVRDSAAALDVTAGPMLGDPYWAPPAPRRYVEEMGVPPGQRRIALLTEPLAGGDVDPECVAAALATATLCEGLGHVVVEAKPDIGSASDMMQAFVTLYAAGAASLMDDWSASTGRPLAADRFEPLTWALAEIGRSRTSADTLAAVARLQRVSRRFAEFLQDYDFLLSPTLAEPPALLGTFDSSADFPLGGFIRAGAYVPFLTLGNVTGNPSMSLPMGTSRGGLPVGVLFTGRFGDETGLFRLAAQIEDTRPAAWLRTAPQHAPERVPRD